MKTLVVCGSKKYKDEIKKFCNDLRKFGVEVFEPNIHEPIDESALILSKHITKTVFKGLTLEHFDWIRKADVCFIYNKNKYVGVSVTLEMGYASALAKVIYALHPDTGDPCRDVLIDRIVPTVKELAQLLR